MNRLSLDLKGLVVGGILLCALLCAVWTQPTRAIEPTTVARQDNLRSLLWNSWTQMGFQGQSSEIHRGGGGNDYPRNGTGAGSWGLVLSQFTSNQKSQMYNSYKTSLGEGIWIGHSGQVSTTGPRLDPKIEAYIVPLPYNPIGEEEENWGVRNPMENHWNGVGRGQSAGSDPPALANYWPGITATDYGSMYGEDLTDLSATTPPVRIANYSLFGYIEDTTLPEEVLISRWVDIRNGITVKRRVYNWSNQDFDDFYIVDLEFTNTGDFDGDGAEDVPGGTADLVDVYIGFKNNFASAAMGITEQFGWSGYAPSRGIDDIVWMSDADGYFGSVPSGYKAIIKRDSDDPVTRPWDDTGDPRYRARENTAFDILQVEGQPCSPSTFIVAPIAYADDAGMFSFNSWDRGKYAQPKTAEQPLGWKWWHVRSETDYDDPFPGNKGEGDLFSTMSEPGYKSNPDESNPDDIKGYSEMSVYGPYDLDAGESCKIVLAWVAGHPSQMKPAPAGTQQMDPVMWDRSSDDVEKKIIEIKSAGEQAAFENLQLAHFAYDADYQIPASPTEAFIAAEDKESSPDARVQISWKDLADRAVNPWTGTADITGYRVYRSTWFSWGPWELWDEITKGTSGETVNGEWTYAGGRYTYEDKLTAAGFAYHYSVRTVNGGYDSWTSANGMTLDDIPVSRVKSNASRGYESGWAPPSARTYDADERKPFQPTTPETDRLEKQILVVPNPYLVDGKHQYPNSRNLRFVGVPSKCIIYIYSAAGDLVKFIEHDNSQKGETSWGQVSYNVSGEVQTGLYYYVVISRVSGSEGATQRGSFVIVK